MKFFNKKEYNFRLLFNKNFLKKVVFKSLLANFYLKKKEKIFFFKYFIKFNKFSSISYYRNYCLIIIDLVQFFVNLRCQGIRLKLFHLLGLSEVCVSLLFK